MGFLLTVLFFFFILYLAVKLFIKLLPFLLFRKNPSYRNNQQKNENNFTGSSSEKNKTKEPIVINQADIIDAEFEDIEDDEKESTDG